MSIGLFDADMYNYGLTMLNLEIMKLARHYRRAGEIVILAPVFSPERHMKFIYRKDYDDGIFPEKLLSYNNIEYGGHAFSGSIYSPLEIEIERRIPDTSIYAKMENMIDFKNKTQEKIFQTMINAEHCRLSLDGSTIWNGYTRQFRHLSDARHLIIHDYDLGKIDGACEEIQSLLKRARNDGWGTRLGMKFPAQISNGDDLLKWTSFLPNHNLFFCRYNGLIDDDYFMEWMNRYKEKSIYVQTEYNITPPDANESVIINQWLPKIFKQITISRSQKIFFPLIYDKDFFKDKKWNRVIDLLNFYHNAMYSLPTSVFLQLANTNTMYDFARHGWKERPYFIDAKTNIMLIDEMREVFRFVQENNPELFNLFYECSYESLGGKL